MQLSCWKGSCLGLAPACSSKRYCHYPAGIARCTGWQQEKCAWVCIWEMKEKIKNSAETIDIIKTDLHLLLFSPSICLSCQYCTEINIFLWINKMYNIPCASKFCMLHIILTFWYMFSYIGSTISVIKQIYFDHYLPSEKNFFIRIGLVSFFPLLPTYLL